MSYSPAFKLGQCVFIIDAEESIIQQLACILPLAPEGQTPRTIITLGPENDDRVRGIVNRVLEQHRNFIWINAATLCTPSDKVVLIAGKSHTGKTTVALRLALSSGWRMLSEDVTLIDRSTNQIVNFEAPFSIRKSTAEILQNFAPELLNKLVLKEWLPFKPFSYATHHKLDFSYSFYLDETFTDGKDFLTSKIAPGSLIRKLLPISNLLQTNSVGELLPLLPFDNCYSISGGDSGSRSCFIASVVESAHTSS